MKNAVCPLGKKCGGCQLQNMDYDRQLKFKQASVIKLLGQYGRVSKISAAPSPFHYRCKVQAAFGMTRSGLIVSGVYQSGSHRIVNVDNCLIEDEKADRIIVTIRSLLRSFKLMPYDEDKATGYLRHVLVRVGKFTGEIMVVLVTASIKFPSKNNFIKVLLEKHPEITTIVQNINPARTNMVLGQRDIILYGNGYIEDTLLSCRFRISPQSFYQINPVQTETLYSIAMDFADLKGNETVIDAYCGTGTIGIIASQRCKQVIGIELNESAVKDAKINASINKCENIKFFCGDAGDFMAEMTAVNETADVVFTDPPRTGCTTQFLSALTKLSPKKIVYISCNPQTLERDLRYLTAHGYTAEKIKPVDMFPFTKHVETVCCLYHQKKDFISVPYESRIVE